MAEYHDRSENPLHRQFGIRSNTIYIIKKVKHYCPAAILIVLLGIICGSILSFYWGIVGKYVIDLVQAEGNAGEKAESLLKLILIAGGIAAVLTLGNAFAQNKTWYRFIYVRMQIITERVRHWG